MPYTNMTNNYQSSKYIVDADGTTPFTTIQSAINQVVADAIVIPVTIEIRPGTYTEDLVLVSDINLTGCSEAISNRTNSISQVTIIGEHTPPAIGQIAFSNIKFESATNILTSAAVGACYIGFTNCIFACADGYVFNLLNWTADLFLNSCSDISASNGVIVNTSGAAIDIIDSQVGAGAIKSLTASGVTRVFGSKVFCPVTFLGTLPTAAAALIQDSTIDALLTVSDDADVSIYNSFLTNTLSCITTNSTVPVKLGNVVIDTPVAGSAIDGAGSINAGEIVFMQTSAIAGTITISGSDVCASSLLRTYGNIDMPATNPAGSAGILYLDSAPFVQSLGTNNTFVGEEAGNLTLTVANATNEVALGFQALHHVTTGQQNCAIGSSALAVTTGSNNIALGYNAGSSLVAAESGNIDIGNTGTIGDSAIIRIGTAQTANYQEGIYQAASGATKEIVYIDSNHKLSSSNLGITQWVTATASLGAAVNTGYLVKMAIPGLCTITLPLVSAVGDVIEITGYTVGGWLIAQNALQQINFIAASSTLGVGGSLASTQRYDSIKLVCATANTDWNVLSSSGNITIV